MKSVKEFRSKGYKVSIKHWRRWKVAYVEPVSKKLIVGNVLSLRSNMECDLEDGWLSELLPNGGKTEVKIYDPASGLDFFADSTCRTDENYNKAIGVQKCLERITDLIRVCAYNNQDHKIDALAAFVN